MNRILVGGLAVALALPFTAVPCEASGSRSLPMAFALWQEGPADVCGTQCRTWVSGVGTITSETPHDFADLARAHDLRGAVLVLDSGGGSVHGAMALGRQVRKLGMTTTVGKTLPLSQQSGSAPPRAKLSTHADCESMCAFALLGGTTRVVPSGARLMVHQIWLGDRRDDAVAATYSAEDLVLVQRDIGRLAQYTIEMGASVEFLELALRIPPWEPMRALTSEEVRRMHVTTNVPAAPVVVAALATEASSPTPAGALRRGADAGARGWAVIEQSGRPVLIRTHPLTVEGEEIGSFDLVLGCGETAGSLDVGYSERRIAAGGVANPLKLVALALGARTEPLRVISSQPVPRSLEWNTQARGSVPLSFIRRFSELSSRALVVSTVSADDVRTMIRVGNSGIAPSLARLQESCGARPLHASNARTGQSGAR
jgi:hypothetical protein